MIDRNLPVLVVEDIVSARETVINLLRVLGFKRFLQAGNGLEAISRLKKNKHVSLIISDWNMPRMNGMQLLVGIKKINGMRDIPFIMLTSKSEIEDVALASDKGVSGYLVKPVTVKALADKINSLEGDSPETVYLEAMRTSSELCAKEEFDQAEEMLRNVAEKYPAVAPKVMFELARVMGLAGRYEEAEILSRDLVTSNPRHAKAWEFCARMQMEQGKWSDAERNTKVALEISPNNADFYVTLAKCQLAMGDQKSAQMNFAKALTTDPKNEQIKQDIWNSYLEHDLVSEVVSIFGPYLYAYLSAETLNNMGVAYRRNGNTKEAMRTYRDALKKDPSNVLILFNLGMAFVNQNDLKKALSVFEKTLKLKPDFQEAERMITKIKSVRRR